jgi:diguanylate cyclase (GGDEF)-like protein/PAS domain S-box-containing protein
VEHRIRVLVVDTAAPASRRSTRAALEAALGPIRFEEADSRERFLKALNEGFYDVIVTDYPLLEGYTGLDVIDALRDRGLDTPVIMLTACGSQEVAVEAMKRGAADYLVKTPENLARLATSVRDALDRVAKARSQRQASAQTQQSLLSEKERAQITLHSIGDGVITTDSSGVVEYLNPIAEALTGWRQADAIGRPLSEVFCLVDEQSRQRISDPAARCLEAGRAVAPTGHNLLVSRDGREYGIQGSAAPIRDRDEHVIGVVLVFKDVTETRRMTRQIAHQASHDSLTGLVNRREFEHRLNRAVKTARESGCHHALAYIDLDQFKVVNDSAGHAAGDALLKQMSNVLDSNVRGRDTLARLGGDEFCLLLENCRLDKAAEIAEALLAAVRATPFAWQQRTFSIGASIGVVAITPLVISSEQALSYADAACYMAKHAGRNRVYVYRAQDEAESHRQPGEIMRAAELADALEHGRFSLYCQPVMALSAESEPPLHYEIFLRLTDRRGEALAPGLIIAAAERYGMMAAIDRWVINAAFKAYRAAFASQPGASIAINLSGDSLSDDGLIATVARGLADSHVPAQCVCFEVTETAAIRNLEKAADMMTAIKQFGCRFALDDFGSGISSFSYLKHLPLDYLKIDGSFVTNMLQDPVDCALVAAINEVGHVLNITTIAECAENENIVAELKRLGVDYAQGFALGRPVPLSELVAERQ